ncbi:MAG: AAA family ATPase [Acidobacteriota bacterium]
MIKRFRIQNYKALRDVTLELTPLHILIGPNDSGKTSILEAIAALCRSVDHHLVKAFTGSWTGVELVWNGNRDLAISFAAQVEDNNAESFEYRLSCRFPARGRAPVVQEEGIEAIQEAPALNFQNPGYGRSMVMGIATEGSSAPDDHTSWARRIHDSFAGIHYYCWSPRFLALPVAPDSRRRFRMESSGFGLALCLDDILGYDRDRFSSLERRFKEIFPQIKSIKLMPEAAFRSPVDAPEQIPMLENAEGKGIYFQFSGVDQPIPASQASDGTLLVLAYLTILYLPEPPRVVLVEEPENGIHPKRLQDVLKVLRELVQEQTRTQVILTTHSPYVLDLFKPEEVTLCQRTQDGSVTLRRLSESATVREQLDVFTLGEIWTAEGDEALAKSGTSGKEPQS